MTSPTIPSGAITAADLYGEVSATRRDMATVLTKVEVMNARHTVVSAQVIDHETRLRTLELSAPDNARARLTAVERWQWRAAGIVSAFAVLGGVVAGLLEALIGHIH